MFKFGKAALYERIIAEKDRQIDILAEQVDYLRMQLAIRAGDVHKPLEIAPPITDKIEVKPFVSDEELDAQALLEAGRITESELPDVLEALGMVPELEFESVG